MKVKVYKTVADSIDDFENIAIDEFFIVKDTININHEWGIRETSKYILKKKVSENSSQVRLFGTRNELLDLLKKYPNYK
jgi:hypothetical protein